MWLTRFALRNPIAIAVAFVALTGAGALGLIRMGRAVLPPIAFPVITVVADYPPAGPRDVERLVVEPLEDQLATVPGIERVVSTAQDGQAQIDLRFAFGADETRIRLDAQRAVDAARPNLPADLDPPIVVSAGPAEPPLVEEAIGSVLLDAPALGAIVANEVAPALGAVGGVGAVDVAGAPVPRILVAPDPAALGALGATVLDIERSASRARAVYAGGAERTPLAQTPIAIGAEAVEPQAVRALPLERAGSAAQLGEVATVRRDVAEPRILVRADGERVVLVVVRRAARADARTVILQVRRAFRDAARRHPELRFEEMQTQGPQSDAAVAGVVRVLAEGIALTVLAIALFLRRWRASLLAALAIPASLAAAFALMWLAGFTLDLLSLMGLSLTIGILVDDSIVIIEAIARRRATQPDPTLAALEGRADVGGVAFAITLVDVVVFAPLALAPALIGAFMREFALVVIFATAFSLLVSFTLTPLLSARWAFSGASTFRRRLPRIVREGPLAAMLRVFAGAAAGFERAERRAVIVYVRRALPLAWRHRRVAIVAVIVACLGAVAAIPVLPTEFSPPTDRGRAACDLTFPPGTSLATVDRVGRALTERVLDDPAVAHVVATAGLRYDGAAAPVRLASALHLEIVAVDPLAEPQRFVEEVRRESERAAPGTSVAGGGRGMGGRPAVAFALAGSGAAVAAARAAAALRADPDALDVRDGSGGVGDRIQVLVDPGRARLLSVSLDDAARSAQIASGGMRVTRVRGPRGWEDVVVRAPGLADGDESAFRRTAVRTTDGRLVPLGAVTRIERTRGTAVIGREDREPVVTVSANLREGAALGPVAARARAAIATVPDARVVARGDVEQFIATVAAIAGALALAALGLYAVLAILYRSVTLPLVIMTTVPTAAVGGIGALALCALLRSAFPSAPILFGQSINLYSMLGIVMLLGLVAKNGILLVEYAERLRRGGIEPLRAVRAAAARRFRPILMTTVAMIAGMLPLALGATPGAEYRRALGTVLIGGLTSSLLLTLLVVPIVYAWSRRGAGKPVPPPRAAAPLPAAKDPSPAIG